MNTSAYNHLQSRLMLVKHLFKPAPPADAFVLLVFVQLLCVLRSVAFTNPGGLLQCQCTCIWTSGRTIYQSDQFLSILKFEIRQDRLMMYLDFFFAFMLCLAFMFYDSLKLSEKLCLQIHFVQCITAVVILELHNYQ